MSRFVNFDAWSNESRLEFLELSVGVRVHHLRKLIDPRFITSFNVVQRRLKLPLHCQKKIVALKASHAIESDEFTQELKKIESAFYGALETV